jgi:hypothetical protein
MRDQAAQEVVGSFDVPQVPGEEFAQLGSAQWADDPMSWPSRRNRLAAALIGLGDRLPSCADVLNQTDPEGIHVAAMPIRISPASLTGRRGPRRR